MRIRNTKELGLLLRSSRQEKALSQQALADSIGVSRHWVIDMERGKPTLEIGLVFRAIVALRLSIDIREAGAVHLHARNTNQTEDVTAGLGLHAPGKSPRSLGGTRSQFVPDLGAVLARARGGSLTGAQPESRKDPGVVTNRAKKGTRTTKTTRPASTTKKKGADR